jgi:hypothetical protein
METISEVTNDEGETMNTETSLATTLRNKWLCLGL